MAMTIAIRVSSRCGRLLDRQSRQEGRSLGERPAGDDRRDGGGGAVARRLVAADPDQRQRGHSGEDRDDQRHQPVAADEAVVERGRVGVQDGEAAERDRSGDDAGAQGADAEGSSEVGFAEPDRVGGEVDGGQVGGGGDGKDADQDRGRVEPAR